MKNAKTVRRLAAVLLLSAALTGCKKADAAVGAESVEVTAEQTAQPAPSSRAGSALDVRLNGSGTYQVNNWAIYDAWTDAGIPETALATSAGTPAEGGCVLLVTLTMTGAGDEYGSRMTVNNFKPVTRTALDNAYLPEGAEDEFVTLSFDKEDYPVYLDIANAASDSDYFYIDTPAAGESVTYTLGYVLSAAGHEAARSGELYLWFSNDEPQAVEDMQLWALE